MEVFIPATLAVTEASGVTGSGATGSVLLSRGEADMEQEQHVLPRRAGESGREKDHHHTCDTKGH